MVRALISFLRSTEIAPGVGICWEDMDDPDRTR